MATVLITGAGGACGVGAIDSLKTETTHHVVGVDMDPTAAGIHLADVGSSVPPAADERWPEAMAGVIDEFDVDVVVPTVDEELVKRSALADALPDSVPIVAPKQDVIDLSLDKYQTMKQLSAAGHPTPDTWLATNAAEIDSADFPLIVKPRRGRGSRGVQRVTTNDELMTYLAETDYSREELLCQDCIDGTEYTTSVVGTVDNRLLSVVPKEAIRKDGSTVLGATRQAPAVRDACRELFETLTPAGPINVQQIVDSEGVPQTIEINPRFQSITSSISRPPPVGGESVSAVAG